MTSLKKAISFKLTRAEGLSKECKTVTVNSWKAANSILIGWSYSAPKHGGYHKCDFEITYEDGEAYSGRYDLDYDRTEGSLQSHIRSFCKMRQRFEPFAEFVKHYELPYFENDERV